MNTARKMAPERSQSWGKRLAGEIPDFIDAFCLAGVNPDNGRYVGWSLFESTSEPIPWPECKGNPANVIEVSSVRVYLRAKTEAGLKFARQQAVDELKVYLAGSQHPGMIEFRNKFDADIEWMRQNRTVKAERVSLRDYIEEARRVQGGGQ